MKIQIKKIKAGAKIPKYAMKGDAGMDLYSIEDVILKPGERTACSTGIAMKIPGGYVGLIWDKSGIAFKNGIKSMGGVIDSNYRGEIKVILINLSKKNYKINKGDKIAQILIQRTGRFIIEKVEKLDNTNRRERGFGSTGIR